MKTYTLVPGIGEAVAAALDDEFLSYSLERLEGQVLLHVTDPTAERVDALLAAYRD